VLAADLGFINTSSMNRSTMSTSERFASPPEAFLHGRWRMPRLTRRDAEAMIQLGIIPEDASTELLDGMVVLKDRAGAGEDPLMIGKNHVISVERLSDLRMRINSSQRHVRSQQPLVCSDTHVPEPDFTVIRGKLIDYTDLPNASDALSVVEVADASYERDAGEKLFGYARAGIAQYVLIDLRNRRAEIHTGPEIARGVYTTMRVVAENEALSIRVGEDEYFTVPLSEILPL
jgi:Uma2 family endonuclease